MGIFDLVVRFADLDGNGRVDYICMDPDGRAEAFLNLESGTRPLKQIKFSEDKDRANHRFADVNGEGKADFLWVDKFTGETHVWYNLGIREESDRDRLKGSIIEWQGKGKLYNGVDRGLNEYFLDYDGDGRADILRVNPEDNSAEVFLNKCSPSPGGVDDENMDPSLPVYSPNGTCDPEEIDYCSLQPGFCDKPSDEDLMPTKRNVDLFPRGGDEQKFFDVNGHGMRLIFLAYPSLREYLGLNDDLPGRILWRFWRFLSRQCDRTLTETGDIPVVDVDEVDPTLPNDILLEVEHIIDRQIMFRWFQDVLSGTLPSGADPGLEQIPYSFLERRGTWDTANAALGALPAVSPGGPQHAIPNDRVMECFGTDSNPGPFTLVGKRINGPKGRIMVLKRPVHPRTMREAARTAMQTRRQADLDYMYGLLRSTFAVFEYMNSQEAALRFNQVRQAIRVQFGNIESTTGQERLVAWWDVWSTDYFAHVERTAYRNIIEAIEVASEEIIGEQDNPNTPDVEGIAEILDTLRNFIENDAENMHLPPDSSMPDPGNQNGAHKTNEVEVNARGLQKTTG